MYLTHEIYDFDPVFAYKNDSALQIVDLLFASLFTIDEKGNVKNELASEWLVDKEKNTVTVTISDGAYWSDGIYVTANDFVYTIKRILNPEFTCDAASLLFCIKNARAVKNATGDLYVDDIGVDAVSEKEVTITFEDGFTDYEGFKRTLASPIFAPLREDLVKNNEGDWAKKPGTMSCSGPFMLRKVSYAADTKGLTLERNQYYFRDTDQKLDKSVTPYRIVVDYTKTAEEQYEMFKNGELFYVGNIALSLRGNKIDNLVVKDAMSTTTVFLNQSLCLGKEIRILDYRHTPAKPSEPAEENAVYDDNGLAIMTLKISEYYTSFNHMTPEDYAEKYKGAEYKYHETVDKYDINFYVKNYESKSAVVQRETMEVNGVLRTVDVTYEENVFVIKDEETGEILADKYDINDGEYLFAIDEIRQALSLVIDREAIAEKVVYASVADALVPNGVFNTDIRKDTFRANGGGYNYNLSTTASEADVAKAQALIAQVESERGIDIGDYLFEFTVRAEDEVHAYIGDVVSEAWKALGFNFNYIKVVAPANDDIGAIGEVSTDIKDDTINEELQSDEF